MSIERPLLLWCSSHATLAAEEIPLLLQAGFRVVPLLTDMWTCMYRPELDGAICSDAGRGETGMRGRIAWISRTMRRLIVRHSEEPRRAG